MTRGLLEACFDLTTLRVNCYSKKIEVVQLGNLNTLLPTLNLIKINAIGCLKWSL
jgi:hypothetical protein